MLKTGSEMRPFSGTFVLPLCTPMAMAMTSRLSSSARSPGTSSAVAPAGSADAAYGHSAASGCAAAAAAAAPGLRYSGGLELCARSS